MPLSVPVDTNPIVKEPPLFTDGEASPSGTVNSTFDYSSTTNDGEGIAYNPNNSEVFIKERVGHDIYVFDGFGSVKRTLNTAISFEWMDYDISAGKFYVANGANVYELDPSNGNVINTISGFTETSFGFSVKDNVIYRFVAPSGNNEIWKYTGLTTTVDSTIDIQSATSSASNRDSMAWVGDFIVVTYLQGGTTKALILDGFTTTVVRTIDFGTGFVSYSGNVDGRMAINNVSANTITTYKNEDDGANFTGNSGKTLEEGKIYSFEIQGPNTVTDPTINDDGQGAFTITLPGGATIPVGALTGNFDFFYDGTSYVVVTLTESMAEAVYGYEPGVLDNLTATTDPTVNDDSDDGYAPRSRWFNTSSSEAFMCLDATVGAAVWVKTSLTLDELGSAAVEDVGTTIGDVVQLENVGGSAGMPAVDGSQLTGIGGARIVTGTYTGDGTTSQSITGIGFQPKYVKIVRKVGTGNNVSVFEAWDSLTNMISIMHLDSGSSNNHRAISSKINSFDADGFTVDDTGVDQDPNTNGVTYAYMAIG